MDRGRQADADKETIQGYLDEGAARKFHMRILTKLVR